LWNRIQGDRWCSLEPGSTAQKQQASLNKGLSTMAFRVNEEELIQYCEKISTLGLHIADKIERNYFIHFIQVSREYVMELAVGNPDFSVDESVEKLGTDWN